jgi:ankyrin repeat protein
MNKEFIHNVRKCFIDKAIEQVKSVNDINQYDIKELYPALHAAVIYNQEEVVKEILNRSEVDVNLKDYTTDTALIRVCMTGNYNIFRMLIERDDLDLNIINKFNEHPFYHAVIRGHFDIVRDLVNDNRLNFKGTHVIQLMEDSFNVLYKK